MNESLSEVASIEQPKTTFGPSCQTTTSCPDLFSYEKDSPAIEEFPQEIAGSHSNLSLEKEDHSDTEMNHSVLSEQDPVKVSNDALFTVDFGQRGTTTTDPVNKNFTDQSLDMDQVSVLSISVYP